MFVHHLTSYDVRLFISVTYPLDLTKTRLQIQGEGGAVLAKKKGFVKTAYGIGKTIKVLISA